MLLNIVMAVFTPVIHYISYNSLIFYDLCINR